MGHHRPASETPFKWRFAGVPVMAQHWMPACHFRGSGQVLLGNHNFCHFSGAGGGGGVVPRMILIPPTSVVNYEIFGGLSPVQVENHDISISHLHLYISVDLANYIKCYEIHVLLLGALVSNEFLCCFYVHLKVIRRIYYVIIDWYRREDCCYYWMATDNVAMITYWMITY